MAQRSLSPVTYDRRDISDLTKTILYKGFFTLSEYRFRFRKFDGSMSPEVCREVLVTNNAIALLAYDMINDEVVLVEQIRIAAVETQSSPWMIELIAGIADKKGETLENVARREAKEEAGIDIGRCKQIAAYLQSSGGMTEKLTLFIGEVDASTAKGIHGLTDENEDIKVHVVLRKQAYDWVTTGVINNAASLIGLQWLQLHHHELKKEWQSKIPENQM